LIEEELSTQETEFGHRSSQLRMESGDRGGAGQWWSAKRKSREEGEGEGADEDNERWKRRRSEWQLEGQQSRPIASDLEKNGESVKRMSDED
jgi:hypothetical protein